MRERLSNQELPLRNANVIATELIREAIIDGRLAPGERLKEEELAQELGVSRTPVREALLVLQSEGLVQAVPKRGSVVRAYAINELDELYQLRALLEGYAARLAAGRIRDDEVAELRGSCEAFSNLRDDPESIKDLVEENLFFHSRIVQASGSPLLAELIRRVTEVPLVYRTYVWYSPGQKLVSEHYHIQLTAALDARDAERAELVMKEHIFEARDHLVRQLREREENRLDSSASNVFPTAPTASPTE